TRSSRDWSSDVCSSDLGRSPLQRRTSRLHGVIRGTETPTMGGRSMRLSPPRHQHPKKGPPPERCPCLPVERTRAAGAYVADRKEIGRASGRERRVNTAV